MQEHRILLSSRDVPQAWYNLAADLRIYGVVSGGVPSPHSPVPDLSVDFTAPLFFDAAGQRIPT